ncbi:diacylglycerol kinase [Microaerobacter geothermalis]|uniref:diacylglycerol kinase n=1 Tax=Microaerobacter geothermalis TaxID=674972 RepID=UPI001F21248D|nr:diacylglycerol kinase [Microaerobacter geothermalis]MCF6093962.1 diacylglycerol kinase [Microaerobacter geothermalis]
MKRARLIYNPSAGREEIPKRLPYILDRLETAGLETSCHATKGSGDAIEAAKIAVERKYDIVIAAGGDGTINEVVNGLSRYEKRPALGIIPAGTSNDLANALGIPKSISKACEIIANGKLMTIDVGKANKRYFINIAGGGYLTELTYEVPSKLKTVLGQLAYYMKGIEKLPFIKPTKIRLEMDHQTVDEEMMLFLVANSSTVGGFDKLAPKADLQDGLFDVLVVKKTTLAEFVKLASLTMKGEHIQDPHILYFQTSSLRASSESVVHLNVDGEFGGDLPVEFKVLPRHIQVFV